MRTAIRASHRRAHSRALPALAIDVSRDPRSPAPATTALLAARQLSPCTSTAKRRQPLRGDNRAIKHATDYLWFETPNRRDYLNITPQVEEFVRTSGIRHGLCLVNPMHITAAVYVNDAESGLIQDFDDWLERLAPHEPVEQYRHNNGEDNADAHLKRHLMSHQVVLAITDGKLDLGPWEQVFYAEFDGRRRKRVLLKAIGD